MKILRARLFDYEQGKINKEQASARKSQVGSGDRSERIRTYNFPQTRVSDHRINLTLHNLNEMMEGDLNKMIEAMGLSRARVYIANVVKCRPPQNRNPAPDEVASCSPLLKRQIELVGPDVIVALGSFASRCLLNEESPIAQLRGRFAQCRFAQKSDGSPIFVMPTFHPAYLLRNPEMKKPAWEDLKQVMARLAL